MSNAHKPEMIYYNYDAKSRNSDDTINIYPDKLSFDSQLKRTVILAL